MQSSDVNCNLVGCDIERRDRRPVKPERRALEESSGCRARDVCEPERRRDASRHRDERFAGRWAVVPVPGAAIRHLVMVVLRSTATTLETEP